ncbi:hypothetical protein H4R20_001748 [Coemansia guatemalensis]|uniref:PH domain-containing protein n=1 Tax=Coemansia guatemalensis TaxID=2761395 RepID=A0A9W8HWS1_9FUNG|nr:hypothetical protein H4R20_001748 [Coemansia guatemalensis]
MSMEAEDSWVVVDKTSGGSLQTKASHESLYLSDNCDEAKARVHVQSSNKPGEALAPELLEWINNAASESSTALPLGERNPSVSKSSYRTNSSSAGSRQASPEAVQQELPAPRRRTGRRSSVHATSSVSSVVGLEADGASDFNEGMFVVKVVEVRQVGAARPMNLQCVAQVGEERFVIPPVMTKLTDYNVWTAKLNDTFVFDVARQFTFNLGVYGTQPHPGRARTGSVLGNRVSLAPRRHPLARNSIAVGSESNSSLATNGTTRTTAKLRRGLRKIFRNKGDGLEGIASDPAYAGYSVPDSPPKRHSIMAPVSEDVSLVMETDSGTGEQATDGMGREIEIRKHVGGSIGMDAVANDGANVGAVTEGLSALPALESGPGPQQQGSHPRTGSFAEFAQHPAISRLSSYLPRNRTSTTTSAHEINYNGPRLRAFSNASTISSTPAALGELFLDLRVERREKRRATFTLPVVNQEQVALRGGTHVEMQVVLEYGVVVRETWRERQQRAQQEARRELGAQQAQRQQRTEQQWAAVDEQDRQARLRGFLSVFTRSGRVSSWRRYWAVLSPTRLLFYDSEADEVRGRAPAARVSLFHLLGAGLPESDLVSIGATGLELRLSPLAMTDRHRRKSAHPRQSAVPSALQLRRDAARHPLPGMERLAVAPESGRASELSSLLPDEDDATLAKFSDWRCRVYILLDSLSDRDVWLRELRQTCVPSCEFARFRQRQRRAWRTRDFESATAELRQSGKELQVVAAQALDQRSSAHNASARVFFERVSAKPVLRNADVFLERISTKPAARDADVFFEKVPAKHPFQNSPLCSPSSEDDLEGATLTSIAGAARPPMSKQAPAANPRKPVATAFGKPATFDVFVKPTALAVPSTKPTPPAKKRLRALRRSSSVSDLRPGLDAQPRTSDDDDDNSSCGGAAPALERRDSGASTVIEVVGKAMERRPGTVSRRFLFVWNVSDI